MILPVILSGGSGTRLWPYSRALYPKQFLPLHSEKTMLQETVNRLAGFGENTMASPWVICNEEHRFMVAEQMRSVGVTPGRIILEPLGRNTAPAIALAAIAMSEIGDDLMLVLPADHVVRDVSAFEAAVNVARLQAEKGDLVTFGIVPTAPETGYGYIKAAKLQSGSASTVESFVEKPDLEMAKSYLADGNYLWNSGMFLFRASRYLEELEKFSPEILAVCREAYESAASDLDFIRISKEVFEPCPSDSIDYAVMEKTLSASVVSLDAGWSDVGSWSALWDVSTKDEDGNTCRGDIISHSTKDCYIQSDKKLIATVGLDNIVIVETDDALMVAAKDQVQHVKEIVQNLKANNRDEAQVHRKVYRPWGYYDSVDSGERFQVKRIVVNPGAQLSLQMHHHRAEHWIVVQGTAQVRCGENTLLLSENESTYIPLGEVHQLVNPGKVQLEIIEVQSGSYLGEDDIIRLEDVYGRS